MDVDTRPVDGVSADVDAAPLLVEEVEESAWARALERVLSDPQQPHIVYQPIIDLRRGIVVGHEVLSRFSGPPAASPELWFRVALQLGVAAELEARVLRAALDARERLPRNCFLAVNLSAPLLGSVRVQAVLDAAGPLAPLVLEVTEHDVISDYTEVNAVLARYRDAGLRVAVDDTGSGYAGLQQLLTLRPDLVKLDRSLVADADRDEAKLALVEMVGAFAGRLDAWLLAEGIERLGELDACIRLGVPLGQGYLLGRPGAPWRTLDPVMGTRIRETAARRIDDREAVLALVEAAPTVSAHRTGDARDLLLADPALDVVVVDRRRRPVGILDRAAGLAGEPCKGPPQLVSPATPVTELASRMLTRAPCDRFDPSLCCDGRGRYVGIIRVERVVERLVQRAGGGHPPAPCVPCEGGEPVKEFRCGDVVPGCDAVFDYDSYPQLLALILRHGRRDHLFSVVQPYVERLRSAVRSRR